MKATYVLVLSLLAVIAGALELEDKPLQIVYPDATHTNLLINEQNVKLLEDITENVAVVGVVGPFHSGKSFLLNQLMSKPAGFEVGPTVAATTMGLWIWGKPLKKVDPKTGEPLYVLFLDTEGFYASNVSETYDAKIFGVSTLISSYLVFNSVKIINQDDIDYLEILAKRTHLFSLKSQLQNDGDNDASAYPDIISFPPLMWVVEDFFQDLEDKTPTQWVHSLLAARPRDSDMTKATLQSIFPSIDAHTLFLPSVSKYKLQNLNGITEAELHPDYKEGVAELRQKVMEGVAPKQKGSNLLSGKELGSLLRLLVQAANAGTFPNVPSVWGAFLEQQLLSAQEDTIKVFQQEAKKFAKEPLHIDNVLTPKELDNLHTKAQERAEDLFKRLLFGLKEVYTPGLLKLRDKIRDAKEVHYRENNKRIEELCENVRNEKVTDHLIEMEKLKLPIPSKQLQLTHKQKIDAVQKEYERELSKFKGSGAFEKQRKELEGKVSATLNQLTVTNTEKLKAVLNGAVDKASALYRHKTNEISSALTYDEFNKIHTETNAESQLAFEEAAQAAKDEHDYMPYKSHLKQKIDELKADFNARNDKKIEVIISETRVECQQAFNKAVRRLDLPMDEGELVQVITAAQKQAVSTFKQDLSKFAKFDKFVAELKAFEGNLQKELNREVDKNIQYTKDSCVGPFLTAKQRIKEEAPDYFWGFSLERRAREIAEEELTKSGKIKSSVFRRKIIERFMQDDIPEVLANTSTFSFWQIMSFVVAIIVIVCAALITRLITSPSTARDKIRRR